MMMTSLIATMRHETGTSLFIKCLKKRCTVIMFEIVDVMYMSAVSTTRLNGAWSPKMV